MVYYPLQIPTTDSIRIRTSQKSKWPPQQKHSKTSYIWGRQTNNTRRDKFIQGHHIYHILFRKPIWKQRPRGQKDQYLFFSVHPLQYMILNSYMWSGNNFMNKALKMDSELFQNTVARCRCENSKITKLDHTPLWRERPLWTNKWLSDICA